MFPICIECNVHAEIGWKELDLWAKGGAHLMMDNIGTVYFNALGGLNHWARVTHTCVGNLTICSDNGLSPVRRQAIIWTNAGILSIWPLETNFSEILIEILTVSFKNMRFKWSPANWLPFCLGLNVLNLFSNFEIDFVSEVILSEISSVILK